MDTVKLEARAGAGEETFKIFFVSHISWDLPS